MNYKDIRIIERIKEIMREKGLNQTTLGEQTGLYQSDISRMLKLTLDPKRLVEGMESQMSVNRTWLLTGDGPKYNLSDQSYSKNIASLSISDRAKMINDINLLYKRHQDLLAEASNVMNQIVEINKSLLMIEL